MVVGGETGETGGGAVGGLSRLTCDVCDCACLSVCLSVCFDMEDMTLPPQHFHHARVASFTLTSVVGHFLSRFGRFPSPGIPRILLAVQCPQPKAPPWRRTIIHFFMPRCSARH